MKKLLGIVVLGLLLSSNAFAGCSDNIKFSWKVYNKNNLVFNFLNDGDETVFITKLRVFNGEKLLKETEPSSKAGPPWVLYTQSVSRYGKLTVYMDIREFQKKYLTLAGYSCEFR